jgi:hypothetical protein
MSRNILLAYQLLTGASDTCTGALLMVVPGATLALMKLPAPGGDLVYLSYIGSFVFAVGLCCLYGFGLVVRGDSRRQLATVWLLTALLRASVAVFVTQQILTGALALGWIVVAAFDGACVMIQGVGLRKGWVAHAAR